MAMFADAMTNMGAVPRRNWCLFGAIVFGGVTGYSMTKEFGDFDLERWRTKS